MIREIETLLADTVAAVDAAAGGDIAEIGLLAERLEQSLEPGDSHPEMLDTVERYLEPAAALAVDATAAIAASLLGAAEHLRWSRPYPAFAGAPDVDALRAGYASALLIGPASMRPYTPAYHSNCLVAFTVQAPATLYPDHAHRAAEIYHVVGGRAEWKKGEVWTLRDPGEWIFHERGQIHAARTAGEPLLAMAAWFDDLDSEPIIIRT